MISGRNLAILFGLSAVVGCSAKFSPESVRAKAGAPASAVVEEQRIPLDSSLPRYVIAVEMPVFPSWTDVTSQDRTGSLTVKGKVPVLNMDGTGSVEGSSNTRWVRQYFQFDRFVQMIASQFVSALAVVENFSVVDPQGTPPTVVNRGEKGPYIARAQVNIAESRVITDRTRLNLLVVQDSEEVNEGLVELDVQLVEKNSGRVVTAFPVQGTFISKQKRVSSGLLVTVYDQERSARSLIENATRVALMNASRRMFEELRKQK